MRQLGTSLNMLARLGFPRDKYNLEGWPKDSTTLEHAWEALVDGDFAHVLYGVCYRGKRCRNKERLDVELTPKAMECFVDDKSFYARCNELYAKGVYWIGAVHHY